MDNDLTLLNCLDRPFSFFGRPLVDVLVLALPLAFVILAKRLSVSLVLVIFLVYGVKRTLRRSIPPHFFAGALYWFVLPPGMSQLIPAYKRFFLR